MAFPLKPVRWLASTGLDEEMKLAPANCDLSISAYV